MAEMTAGEIVALKAKVKAEMLRRSYNGSLTAYGSTSWDFTNTPTVGNTVLAEQGKKIITALSVGLSIIAVLFLAMAREPYAITVMFLLLFIKGGLLYKQAKAGQ